MTTELMIRYAHFIGIILLSSMLVVENILMSREISAQTLKKLVFVDRLYGIGAVVTLLAGLSLWLWLGKPKAFYSDNPLFHAKLGLFVLIGVLSVVPTIFIARGNKARQESFVLPGYVMMIKRFELIGITLLPLLAVLMARGVGLS